MSTTGLYLLTDEHAVEVARLGGFVERGEGVWPHAIVDLKTLVGTTSLNGADEIGFWVAEQHRGKGFATFGVKMTVQFAFNNRRLPRVTAQAPNAAARRVIEKNGFTPSGDRFELTRERWIEHRDGPALKRLHPALKAILRAELAAGNEVAETGGGWPDLDSVFVRLRYPFRTKPESTAGLDYNEPNDPHWWKADYCSRSPRHILACSQES